MPSNYCRPRLHTPPRSRGTAGGSRVPFVRFEGGIIVCPVCTAAAAERSYAATRAHTPTYYTRKLSLGLYRDASPPPKDKTVGRLVPRPRDRSQL
eukprot:scaffold27344_cov60-Phaeocystis_antarctica.AAC.4